MRREKLDRADFYTEYSGSMVHWRMQFRYPKKSCSCCFEIHLVKVERVQQAVALTSGCLFWSS